MNFSGLFLIGLPADNDVSFAREFNPAGVILMGRNARPATQIRALTQQLPGLIISTDHEGGRVQRLKDGFSLLPPAREVGQGDVFGTAKSVGLELKGAGINLNFAPVCDVPVHPDDTVIAGRAFSLDFVQAGELAADYIAGLQREIGACAKHFPGHGAVGVDSHFGLPLFEGARDELEPHLLPFRRAIDAGVSAVMVAHIVVPCLDSSLAPASLSRPIVSGLLREELGFKGLILTDDLEMGALASLGAGEIAVRAMDAGNDLLLFCHSPQKALEARAALERAVETGRLSSSRIEEALARVQTWKRKWGAGSVGG